MLLFYPAFGLVIDETGHIVINTEDLACSDEVVGNVVELFNQNFGSHELLGSEGVIDEYLLNEEGCTTDDREMITESIHKLLNNKL